MSQSEILKDSASDWPINIPEVTKSTWGNGRNGTEQRALEGIWNQSEWRGRVCRGERRGRPVRYCIGLKCIMTKDNMTEGRYTGIVCVLNLLTGNHPDKQSESFGKAEGKLWKKTGWRFGKRPGVDVCTVKKERLAISALSNRCSVCSDGERNASSKREALCVLAIISSLVLFCINVKLDNCCTITTSVFAIIGTINYVCNLFALLLE